MAKMKKLRTIRPEFELCVNKPFGWLLIPFYALYVYAKAFRLFKANLICGKWKVATCYMLSIPKLKLAGRA